MENENEVEIMPPQKTWFFTDSTSRIFPTNEKEAFDLLTNTSRWRRQDIRMVGMSDGLTYHETIKNAGKEIRELKEKVGVLKETLNKYVAGHDRLLFEEFASKDDPRIVRADTLIKETQAELEPLETELKDLQKNIIKRAFDAELEKARGNMVNPRDFSVIGKTDGSRGQQAILNNIIQQKRVI